MIELRSVVSSLLPGAPGAGAGTAAVVGASALGVPPWLTALGQALVVGVWMVSAVRQHTAATDARLQALEDAIRALSCVKAGAVAKLEGKPPAASCASAETTP